MARAARQKMVIGIAVLSGDTNRWTRTDVTGTTATHAPSLGRLGQPKRPGLACLSADHCRTQLNRQVQTAPHADCRSAFLQQDSLLAMRTGVGPTCGSAMLATSVPSSTAASPL